MSWMWTAFSLGLFGSLHCAGMCGPIAMALPLSMKEKTSILAQSLIYNFGRIASYMLMGLIMGLLGWGALVAGYQKYLSVGMGSILVIFAFMSASLESAFVSLKPVASFYAMIKTRLSRLIQKNSYSASMQLGFLNGFLPCGMVYIALAGALASNGLGEGATYMGLFGLGTLPMMTGLVLISNINRNLILKLRKLLPSVMLIFGLLLIKRGLGIEIPLEMRFWEAYNFPLMCH